MKPRKHCQTCGCPNVFPAGSPAAGAIGGFAVRNDAPPLIPDGVAVVLVSQDLTTAANQGVMLWAESEFQPDDAGLIQMGIRRNGVILNVVLNTIGEGQTETVSMLAYDAAPPAGTNTYEFFAQGQASGFQSSGRPHMMALVVQRVPFIFNPSP